MASRPVPQEFIPKSRRNGPPLIPQEPAPDFPRPPAIHRMSQAAADQYASALAGWQELEQRLAAFESQRNKDEARIQFLELEVSRLQIENETIRTREQQTAQDYGELRGRLDAAAGLMVDIMTKHRPPPAGLADPRDGAAVASTLGENAVANAVGDNPETLR